MALDLALVGKLANTLLSAAAGAGAKEWFESKPKLISYFWHASAFQIPTNEKPLGVHTHGIVIRNAGRKGASNVRVSHHTLPNYQVFPNVQCHIEDLANGGKELVFPLLRPSETVTINYLYYPPLLWNQIHAGIRSD